MTRIIHERGCRSIYLTQERRLVMAKVLRCGDLMAGCPAVIEGATEDEVLKQAAKHAKEAHKITEVTPDLAAKVKKAIRTK